MLFIKFLYENETFQKKLLYVRKRTISTHVCSDIGEGEREYSLEY
jgi:hypothetical protein